MRVDPLPVAVRPVWNAFIAMHERRGSNGYGPNPITWHDIAAWQAVSGLVLTPWEASVVGTLDGVAMAAAAKQATVQQAKE